MSIKSILSVTEAYAKMFTENSQDNLAATDAALAQKKQEPMGDIPDWVPGHIPDDKKKDFAEAARKCHESDNTQFDFDGRVYKITEKLVGNQDKLDVNNNGKIDADDLAALRSGKKQSNESHFENEVETPGQTEYPGSGMKDTNDNEEIDGEDKAELEEGTAQTVHAQVQTKNADTASKRATSYGAKDYHLHMIAHHSHALAAKAHERAADTSSNDQAAADHSGGSSYHHDQSDYHLKAANALKEEVTNLVKEGEEEKYSSSQDNPMSRERRAYAGGSTGSKSYGSKSIGQSHNRANAASAKAREASQVANTSGKPEDHAAAHSAHKQAEKAWHSIGLKFKTGMHADKADVHAAKSGGLVKESTGNPTDKLTIDVPAMIRALEKAREDFKSDEDIHNFVQGLLNKKDQTIDTNALPTNEALDPKADAGVWISDFVHSKDPKFAGKSKEERKQQALAAYYQARRDAGLKEDTTMTTPINENIAGDTRATDLTAKANQASAMAHSVPDEAGGLAHHDAATRAHQQAADHYRIYAHHAGDPVLRHVAGLHHKFHSDMAQHHTLRGVDFSMNEGAPADAKGGPEVMDPKTKKMKDEHDKNVKTEEAPYTNKADGSENIVPADKPKVNPTPTPEIKKESTKMTDPIKSIRTVAQAYVEMHEASRPPRYINDPKSAGKEGRKSLSSYADALTKSSKTDEDHAAAAKAHKAARDAHEWEETSPGHDPFAHHNRMYRQHLKKAGLIHTYNPD